MQLASQLPNERSVCRGPVIVSLLIAVIKTPQEKQLKGERFVLVLQQGLNYVALAWPGPQYGDHAGLELRGLTVSTF